MLYHCSFSPIHSSQPPLSLSLLFLTFPSFLFLPLSPLSPPLTSSIKKPYFLLLFSLLFPSSIPLIYFLLLLSFLLLFFLLSKIPPFHSSSHNPSQPIPHPLSLPPTYQPPLFPPPSHPSSPSIPSLSHKISVKSCFLYSVLNSNEMQWASCCAVSVYERLCPFSLRKQIPAKKGKGGSTI